ALLNEVVRRAETTDGRQARWGEAPHAPRPSRRDGHARRSGGSSPILTGWKVRAGLALAAAIGLGGAVLMVQGVGKAERVAMARKLPALPRLPAALVHGGSGARFVWRKLGEVERIDLEEGEIDLTVRHLGPSERVIVSTGDAEVEVRGTVFHVAAHARHVARVAVTVGRVEVRYAGDQVFLDAGQAWSPPGGGDGLARAGAAAGSEHAEARSG